MEVFLLLGVIWAAVLIPQWLENRRDARPTASIASFNRRLWSLERMTPVYDDSAYGSTYGEAPLAPGRRANVGHGRVAGSGRAGAAHGGWVTGHIDGRLEGRVDGRFEGWIDSFDEGGDGHGGPVPADEMIVFDDLRGDREVLAAAGGPATRSAARTSASAPVTLLDAARSRPREAVGRSPGRTRAGGGFGGAGAPDVHAGASPAGCADVLSPATARARRRAAAMRRRRILSTLLLLAFVTLVVATPLGQPWWVVHGVADGLVAVYLALLVRRRRRLAEQARKVHHLSALRAPRSGVVVYSSTGTGR